MAIVYFDSSAFLKLVVEEDGSELAAALWDGCDAAVSSRLAYPEVRAALAAGVLEFRDHATSYLSGSDPITVSKRGRVVGFYLPRQRDEDEVTAAVTSSARPSREGADRKWAHRG